VAAALALVMPVAALVVAAVPAQADLGDLGQVTLAKQIDGLESETVQPGEAFQYSFLVGCDDNPCLDATLDDPLPEALAGFAIGNLSVSNATTVSASLDGCTVGGQVTTGCALHATFAEPLGALAGAPVTGIDAGNTFRVTLSLTPPANLAPDWAWNNVPIVNTATAASRTSVVPQVSDDATVTVAVPYDVDVAVTKQWNPATVQYAPGTSTQMTLGVRNTSNAAAASLVLQDPQDAADGATALAPSNPFRYVDLAGLCAPSALPAGADRVQVDAYFLSGGVWSWVNGTPAATATLPTGLDPGQIGGLRFTYTSTTGATLTAQGAAASQCVTVDQRSTNRETGASLVSNDSVPNVATGTVTVPGEPPVTKTATATLAVEPLTVAVTAGKQITPNRLPASQSFAVNVSAKNESSGALQSLTIAEPGAGGSFLSDKLQFTGITGGTWPTGATAASITWTFSEGSPATTSGTSANDPGLTTPPAHAGYVTGFTTTWTGDIAAGTSAGWTFAVKADVSAVSSTETYHRYPNTIDVAGTNPAGTDTANASAPVDVYYPTVGVDLLKTLSPKLTTAGGTVVAELKATTTANVSDVNPTQIVVIDVWDGQSGAFWDAFRARKIVFTDVPAGATMAVEYTTGTDPVVWQTLATGVTNADGLYSLDLTTAAGVTADDIVGLRFTFDKGDGFAQGTIVKPNVVFQASDKLRDGTATATVDADPTSYDNLATTDVMGKADTLRPTAHDEDDDTTAIAAYSGDAGTVLAGKRWVEPGSTQDLDDVYAQSGATARTLLSWGVTVPGYDEVQVSDALPGSETTPASTTFQAFDLRAIQPVTFTQDPLLRWDTVSSVELYYGGAWHEVPAPAGTWMDANGFKGYTLTGTESAGTTGVRVTVEPNDAARAASADPTRPDAGTGVASSGVPRTLGLVWQLRNVPRGAGDWVTQDSALNGGQGVVRNDVGVAATTGGTTSTRTAHDEIAVVDSEPNVGVDKAASVGSVVAPYPGDVVADDYPTVDFTVTAWNAAFARASYLRVTDPGCDPVTACVTDAGDHGADVFGSRGYDPATNPFERFTITGVDVATPTTMQVDRTASTAALWHRAANGTLTVETMTLDQLDGLDAAQLADVVGVAVVFQSTNPGATGGLLPMGVQATMTLHTRLRDTLRSDPGTAVTGTVPTVRNEAVVQGFDPVLAPDATPNGSDAADVLVTDAALDVTAAKTITPDTLTEPNATAPVQVTLGAADGAATMAPQTVTIADTDPGFWAAFRLTGLGAVTLPAGADLVRVDVQLGGDSTWVAGQPAATAALPAGVADLASVTGVRFVFLTSSGLPFSATVPSADWSAQAVIGVQLRDGVAFPGVVDNTVDTYAEHEGRPAAHAQWTDEVLLSLGTPRISVQKESPAGLNHVVDPGEAEPWTLTFTNIGTSYLGITRLDDYLGPSLRYAGSQPTFVGSGLLPTTGITVTQPDGEDSIVFGFPAGSRMAPGDTFTVTVDVILLPGLTGGQVATNEFRVVTDRDLAPGDCVNQSGNGQGLLDDLAADECGTSNYVKPTQGPLLFAEKEVQSLSTLTDGAAVNITNADLPCTAAPGGWYRTVCTPYTSVGATDQWRIGASNTGTVPYRDLTYVDVLPRSGDVLLSTGAARGSDFRPVLDGAAGIVPSVTPAGFADTATYVAEVSTDATACFGAAGNAWSTDPICAATTWTAWDSYAGAWSDVTAIRVRVDFGAAPMQPGQLLSFVFQTVDTPLGGADATDDAIAPALWDGPQFAWNQVGTAATLTDGRTLSRAPARTGVQLLPGALEVHKAATGDLAATAPDHVVVDVACTVAGVAVDLGSSAALTVPTGGSARIDGLPLGADCTVAEHGDLGEYGETARTPDGARHVVIDTPVVAGEPVPTAQVVTVENRYDDPPAPTVDPTPTPTVSGGASLGTDDPVTPAPSSGRLAFTGATGLAALAALATALVAIGLVLRGGGRRGRRDAARPGIR
jgi:hypothetical protein